MNRTCPEFETLVDLLTVPERVDPEVRNHTEACPTCRGELAVLAGLEAALLARAGMPADWVDDILALLAAPRAVAVPWWRLAWQRTWPPALTGVLAAVTVALGTLLAGPPAALGQVSLRAHLLGMLAVGLGAALVESRLGDNGTSSGELRTADQ